eukprot:357589-Chlamydomonas_euryale.AAC.1
MRWNAHRRSIAGKHAHGTTLHTVAHKEWECPPLGECGFAVRRRAPGTAMKSRTIRPRKRIQPWVGQRCVEATSALFVRLIPLNCGPYPKNRLSPR